MSRQLVRPNSVAAVQPVPSRRRSPAIGRRRLLQLGFWSSVGGLFVAGGASIANSLYPRKVDAFGGPVAVGADWIPEPGDPPKPNFDGHFLLVNLEPGEGLLAGDEVAAPGGLLALWWKCPHLGCTVPWKASFVSPQDPLRRKGCFNCNCHGSTYTKAGLLLKGPANRPMDTMLVEVAADGSIVVQTGERTKGDDDNPRRAVPWRNV